MDKIRTIGAGIYPHRFFKSFISFYYQADIARILPPHHYCVGIQGGFHLLSYTTMFEVDIFVA